MVVACFARTASAARWQNEPTTKARRRQKSLVSNGFLRMRQNDKKTLGQI
jgi:hypothetical protein